jgi:hypothetical protein
MSMKISHPAVHQAAPASGHVNADVVRLLERAVSELKAPNMGPFEKGLAEALALVTEQLAGGLPVDESGAQAMQRALGAGRGEASKLNSSVVEDLRLQTLGRIGMKLPPGSESKIEAVSKQLFEDVTQSIQAQLHRGEKPYDAFDHTHSYRRVLERGAEVSEPIRWLATLSPAVAKEVHSRISAYFKDNGLEVTRLKVEHGKATPEYWEQTGEYLGDGEWGIRKVEARPEVFGVDLAVVDPVYAQERTAMLEALKTRPLPREFQSALGKNLEATVARFLEELPAKSLKALQDQKGVVTIRVAGEPVLDLLAAGVLEKKVCELFKEYAGIESVRARGHSQEGAAAWFDVSTAALREAVAKRKDELRQKDELRRQRPWRVRAFSRG